MIRRILIATDGSALSRRAVAHGIALARTLQATVVGLHNRLPYPTIVFAEATAVTPSVESEYERQTRAFAQKCLAEVAAMSAKAGVEFKGVQASEVSSSDAIIRTATKERCDLIVMASHGRSGLARALVGSETQSVLTHSTIPVLVTR